MTISFDSVFFLLILLNIVVLVQNVIIVISSKYMSTQLEVLRNLNSEQIRLLEYLGRRMSDVVSKS